MFSIHHTLGIFRSYSVMYVRQSESSYGICIPFDKFNERFYWLTEAPEILSLVLNLANKESGFDFVECVGIYLALVLELFKEVIYSLLYVLIYSISFIPVLLSVIAFFKTS